MVLTLPPRQSYHKKLILKTHALESLETSWSQNPFTLNIIEVPLFMWVIIYWYLP